MPKSARALIIAVEEYPGAAGGGLAKKLPGTLDAGRKFQAWLEAKWALEDPDRKAPKQILWCSEPKVPGGRGATSVEIKAALLELRTSGARATDELFVFFSGHGFASTNPAQGRADFLVGSDFTTPELSSHTCLKLDGIVRWLRDHLGPGQHYYFVDACRNVLNASVIMPPELGLPVSTAAQDEPSTFVLQSTTPGATAAVGSAFPSTLLDGLGGKGTAKDYATSVPDGMVVHYDSLFGYVQSALKQQMVTGEAKGTVRPNAAILATVKPVPTLACTVAIDDAEDTDTGVIRIRRGRGPVETHALTGRRTVIRIEPDVYTIAVTIDGASVDPDGFVERTLFDDQPVAFVKGAPLALGVGFGAAPPMEMEAPVVRSVRDGAPLRVPAAGPPWAGQLVCEKIAAHFPHDDKGVWFSESLGGPIEDADVDVWLAILAGGRALLGRPGHGDFQKIAALPLYDFRQEVPGASPIYVLAALPDARLEVRLGTDATTPWAAGRPVSGIPGLFELRLPATPGSCLVSLRTPGLAAATLATVAVPNRATLLTASWDEDKDLRLGQYLVPMGHLMDHLHPEARSCAEARPNHLWDVWKLADASRLFRARRRLEEELAPDVAQAMAKAQWIDPLASVFLAYDRLRAGDRDGIGRIVDALGSAAPEIPDVAALAALSGRPTIERQVPLILDGLRAFGDDTSWLPLPAARLDQRGPWTVWRNAVA